MVSSSELRFHSASIRLLVVTVHMLELVDGVVAVVVAAIALVLVGTSPWMYVNFANQLSTDVDSSTTAWALHILSSMMVLVTNSCSILSSVLRLIEQGLIMTNSTQSSIWKATELRTTVSEHRLCLRWMSSIC